MLHRASRLDHSRHVQFQGVLGGLQLTSESDHLVVPQHWLGLQIVTLVAPSAPPFPDCFGAAPGLVELIRRLLCFRLERRDQADSKVKVSFDDIRDAAASKIRLYRLFGLLVKALSEPKRPLLISFDDLQWADTASFELMNSLLEGVPSDELPTFVKNEGSCVLFVGCYRSNEDVHVDTGPLSACIKKMNDSDTIMLTKIRLDGLSSNDVNILVSEALFYPRRLTRSLADLIHQKSAGNPFFVREFLNNLATENLLKYSLSRHTWDWDENVIEMKAVSNGVADLLTSRLERLPAGVLSVLQVMSCFSGKVSLEIFLHVGDVCDSSNVTTALECARKELLVKKSNRGEQSFYTFAHDMVQNTVFGGIGEEGRLRLLKEIADTLIVKTSEERKDSILFIIVGLINRVDPRHMPSSEDRVRYAKLNLLAGKKSIQIPDFPSAFDFIKYGILFLDDNHWESEYDLSLNLFTNGGMILSVLYHLLLQFSDMTLPIMQLV